jgi:hypothetical protein
MWNVKHTTHRVVFYCKVIFHLCSLFISVMKRSVNCAQLEQDEHTADTFGLMRETVSEEWRKLNNEFYNLYSSPNIITVITSIKTLEPLWSIYVHVGVVLGFRTVCFHSSMPPFWRNMLSPSSGRPTVYPQVKYEHGEHGEMTPAGENWFDHQSSLAILPAESSESK